MPSEKTRLSEAVELTDRQRRRRIRQLHRQRRHLERRWEKANRAHGLPARPAIDAHYDKLAALTDEIKALSRV